MGETVQIVNDTVDPGFRDATVGSGQILANALTAGVNTYNYAAFAQLTVTGTAQSLMLGSDLVSVMMAYQNIGPGSIFLITDQNVWDNVGQVGSNDNHQMFENLLQARTGAPPPPGEVPEPSTFALLGGGVIAMFLARRNRQ